MGSPLTALLCRTIGSRIGRDTEVARRVLGWPGNPDGWADGLPLRLCGGLHALVRSGKAEALQACYPPHRLPEEEVLWDALARTLETTGEDLLPWLDHPPQTNEVGRSNALMAGLLVIASQFGVPIRLYELGASAGLNLNLDRYCYDLGGTRAGDPDSPLQLRPDWQGAPPPQAEVTIIGRGGVDLQPMDPVRDRERLIAYVWPDQRQRIEQLEKAVAVAEAHPPLVDRGDAADWLEAQLLIEPEPGVARVVMHSVAYQYFPQEVQARIAGHIGRVGHNATAESPLAWLRFEKEPQDRQTSLRLTLWPSGKDRLLAYCQAHGRSIEWLQPPSH